MSMAILRTAKLKTLGNVAGSGSHVMRTRDTPNANLDIENISLVGSGDLLQDVKNVLPEKYRKNAVLCVENLLSASPDFFKNKSDAEVKKWADASVDSMRKFWGVENVVSATLHLDESTPHIHLYAVPKIGEKLNCREFIGGRAKLSGMQDHYANDMRALGLDRGLKGSKAKHKTMKEISAQAANAKPKLRSVTHTVLTKHEPRLIGSDVIETKEIKVVSTKSAKAAVAAAQAVPLLQAKNNQLRNENRLFLDSSLKFERDAKLSLLRDQDLREIASKFGFVCDEKDKAVYRRDQMKVSINGTKFMDFKNGGSGGGAIDFVMYAEKTDFKNAVALLSHEMSPDYAALSVAKRAVQKELKNIKEPKPRVTVPDHAPWLDVNLKNWLHEVRKVPLKIVEDWFNRGLVYASAFGNRGWQAVWKQSEASYFVENPATAFKGWSAGSKHIPLIVRDSSRIAVVESHVDGMSLAALDANIGICVAASTSNVKKAVVYLQKMGKEVVIAVDNDRPGDIAAMYFAELERITPRLKDWNDDLVALENAPALQETGQGQEQSFDKGMML